MSTEKMRESFEEWHQMEYPAATLARRASGEYVNLYVGMCWIGWQASRAAIAIELPDAIAGARRYQQVEAAFSHKEGIDECRQAIESLGLEVTP